MLSRSWFIPVSILIAVSICSLIFSGCTSRMDSQTDNQTTIGDAGDQPVDPSELLDTLSATGGSETPAEQTIQFLSPDGWSPVAVSGLQKAAFRITEGDLSAEISVMQLPGPATKLLPNVNMWRKRVGLEAITQDDLDGALESIELDGQSAHYITLEGPADGEQPLAMLVVLASEPQRAWFVKMVGDAILVLRERDNFESFVKSLRMERAE